MHHHQSKGVNIIHDRVYGANIPSPYSMGGILSMKGFINVCINNRPTFEWVYKLRFSLSYGQVSYMQVN